jgi:hypothetical protein
MKKNIKTTFVKCIKVNDPETNELTELEIHYDPEAKAMFAVESSFLEQFGVCNSPYNTQYKMMPTEPPENYKLD